MIRNFRKIVVKVKATTRSAKQVVNHANQINFLDLNYGSREKMKPASIVESPSFFQLTFTFECHTLNDKIRKTV